MIEPLLSRIILGLSFITLCGLLVTAFIQFKQIEFTD